MSAYSKMNVIVYNQPILTPRQEELYRFISKQLSRGKPPSTREMATHMGCSQPNVLQILSTLERKELIKREKGFARGISLPRLAETDDTVVRAVPIFGHISAGLPDNAVEYCDDIFQLDMTGIDVGETERLFALRVRGDSMINAHVVDGDIAVMAVREPVSENIVAALIDNDTTLKRYVITRTGCFLRAENPLYANLIPITDLRIQGVMIALIRGRK